MGDRIVVMKDGFIQQIDTPMELYNNPKNMFVAGFIGTPPMNFHPVSLTGDKLTEKGINLHQLLNSLQNLKSTVPRILFSAYALKILLLKRTQQTRLMPLLRLLNPLDQKLFFMFVLTLTAIWFLKQTQQSSSALTRQSNLVL